MEKDKIISEIGKTLEKVLKHNQFILSDALSAVDVDGWDSLTHMLIISEIETRFNIKFKLRELNKLNNIGNLVDLVHSKLIEIQ